MTTWAEHLAARDRSWVVWATVQGIGDGDGLWRFSNRTAWTLSAGQGSWRPYLTEPPSLLSSRVPYVEGGVTEDEGSVSLSVLDVGGLVTDRLQVDQVPTNVLVNDRTATSTLFTLQSGHGLVTGDVVWCGAEAILVGVGFTSTIDSLTRGYLGTNATPHPAGSPVYTRPNVLRNREVKVYVGPAEGSESDAQLVATYTLDAVNFDEAHTTWNFSGELREPYLDRRCPRDPFILDAESVVWANPNDQDGFRGWRVGDASGIDLIPNGSFPETFCVARADGDEGSEVVRVTFGNGTGPGIIFDEGRGEAGSQEEEPEAGRLARVLSVPRGDFRRSTNAGSTAGRTASWQATDHVVDILLALLTSSALEDDGLQFGNIFTSPTTENFSGLPVGYGIGVPVDRIDFGSFLEVRARLPNARLPNFILGPNSMSFRELATEQLLRPFGLILTSEAGQIVLRLPRFPTADEVGAVTVDPSNILARENEPGNWLPRVEVERDITETSSAVEYVLGRSERKVNVSWADFPRLFDPLDLYETEGETQTVKVLGADPNRDKVFRDVAKRKLWQTFRPPTLLRMDVDASLWEWGLTVKADVTLPGVVNPATGQRGFTEASTQLIEREEVFDVDRGVHMRVAAHLTPVIRVGRISPSAAVSSVSTNTATVVANRFTSSDAQGGLPTTDAEAFEVGAIVRLVDSSGADVGGTTQTVSAVSGNDITLDGNFGGNLAADTVLTLADADESGSTERGRYVFLADLATFAIPGVSDAPWQFGAP